MNERIKKLRKTLNLTQQSFAERIGTTQNNIANYESGRRNPSGAAINNICKEFSVNETWLKTGNGEMFKEKDETIISELADKYHLDELDIRIIESYLKLPPNYRSTFRQFIQTLVEQETSKDPIQSELDAYRVELEAEDKEATSSASEESAEKTKMA